MLIYTCQCGMKFVQPVPDKWAEKYPEMKGKCPDCVAEIIARYEGETNG